MKTQYQAPSCQIIAVETQPLMDASGDSLANPTGLDGITETTEYTGGDTDFARQGLWGDEE